ncbi:hypothetical protein FISHEDRAFT_46580, partial [Fistulina hepatica ATCC 64428]
LTPLASSAVYFNPAKTIGGMIEADIFCLFGLAYASIISLSGMSLFRWLENLAQEGHILDGCQWIGDVVAIFWVAAAIGVIAWLKLWMVLPITHPACSMTCIILFIVVIKEGGLATLLQVAYIIFWGSLISNAACFLLWPVSATYNLQTNMTKTLDSFATLLVVLTNAFLLEDVDHADSNSVWFSPQKIQRAVDAHQTSFTSLKKALVEARSEWLLGDAHSMSRKLAYEDAVDSLNRLAQHLNGLRGGTRLQYEISKAGVGKTGESRRIRETQGMDEETLVLSAAAAMFGDIVDELGPPLKALSTTCSSSLKRLRASFDRSHRHVSHIRQKESFQPHEFSDLAENITKALLRFESTSNHAVLRLYRRSDISTSGNHPSEPGANNENALLLARHDAHEHVFLVYFFIFTLQEFASEMISLIDAVERMYVHDQYKAHRPYWWRRWARSLASFIRRWTKRSTRSGIRPSTAPPRPGIRRSLSQYIIPQEFQRRHPVWFPKVQPHAPNTIQTPSTANLNFIGRIKQRIWVFGKRLTERDTKYALKVGMAAGLFSGPAFFDSTRPIFVEYWGDWALISFFVVMSPTIGGTNHLSLQRVLCTLIGASLAAGVFLLFSDQPVVLALLGFVFSLPCFYVTVAKPKYVTASRFVLLTYNLTCLYWQVYDLRRRNDLSPVNVAWHRAFAVTCGVVYAFVVSRFWWPSEARRELNKALGECCLNMAWLYSRLVASNSFAPVYDENEHEDEEVVGERAPLLSPAQTRLHNSIHEFMAMELHLQIKLIEIQTLITQAEHEPRLKGPFPVGLYRGILTSFQNILDKLHSMRCVTTREEWYTSVRRDFIIPVNKERRELVGNIILSFYILSAAIRLKAPVPPCLPRAELARQRLVDAIRKLDVVRNRDVKGSRQLLFFAYALTMKGVTSELESLGHTLQQAFGIIGQSPEDFEALFLSDEERTVGTEVL